MSGTISVRPVNCLYVSISFKPRRMQAVPEGQVRCMHGNSRRRYSKQSSLHRSFPMVAQSILPTE